MGTRGFQPDALRDHSGTVFGPKSPEEIDFGDFHDHWVDVWVQGAFATVFRVVLNPDYDFSDRLGIRDYFENRRKSELNQDVYPVVVKIAEIYFFGRFGAKNGPRMVSESVRLGSPSP